MTTPAGVIFDMDGTLLDSMFYWNQVPADCLRQIYARAVTGCAGNTGSPPVLMRSATASMP